MNPELKLKVLIEIEAIKAEIEGMKQNNLLKQNKDIGYHNESLFYQGCEFSEKADEMRSLISKYNLDSDK